MREGKKNLKKNYQRKEREIVGESVKKTNR